MYGTNLKCVDGTINPLVKEVLKCVRSGLTEKREMRKRESITEDEIEMLEQKYLGLDLPNEGAATWEWTGFCYQNMNSPNNDREY